MKKILAGLGIIGCIGLGAQTELLVKTISVTILRGSMADWATCLGILLYVLTMLALVAIATVLGLYILDEEV